MGMLNSDIIYMEAKLLACIVCTYRGKAVGRFNEKVALCKPRREASPMKLTLPEY